MKKTRIIALDGVHNFRDFGGWPTQSGGAVAWGRLFRSGHLAYASPADLAVIERLRLHTLADLRQPVERARQPNLLPPQPPAQVLECAVGGYTEAPHLQFLRENDLSADAVRGYMQSAYARIPAEAHHRRIFAKVFRALAQGGPVLVHCAAGKDRTGILSALVLMALGADMDAVFEDYLLTNKAVDIEPILPVMTRRVAQERGKTIHKDALRPMLGVEADYLRRALEVIGPLDRYLQSALGLDGAICKTLRQSLVP